MVLEARKQNIAYFVQGGVGPEDWQRQWELKAEIPELIPVFGLHPYWVHDCSLPDSLQNAEEGLDRLAANLHRCHAVGEMGLDFRPRYLTSQGLQIEIFERQLELAKFAEKPVVLHLVQAHEEAMKILSLWELPSPGGMVHAFNGSASKAKDFLSFGLMISIGGAVCRPDNQRLHQAVREIPLQNLLIESDAPDQAPPVIPSTKASLSSEIPDHFSRPTTILRVAETLAQIKQIPVTEVLDRTSQNARKLFSL
jgi:TatD DNase family protein